GTIAPPKGSKSVDGYELSWATNAFGPFVFTHHLLPLLISTAESLPPGTVRIINTASDGAAESPKEVIPISDPTMGTGSVFYKNYGRSKLGALLWTRELGRRYTEKGIWTFGPHPGVIRTDIHTLWLTNYLGVPKPLTSLWKTAFAKPVEYGALTILYAGTSPEVTAAQSGGYLVPIAKFSDKLPHPKASDAKLQTQVWEWLEKAMEAAGAN
ncbi:hypothetical protein K439DRAFT_1377110, partial [Ramaria rubella]